jgi:hypothetical protein
LRPSAAFQATRPDPRPAASNSPRRLENHRAKLIYSALPSAGSKLAVSYASDATQDRFQGGTGGTEVQLPSAISAAFDTRRLARGVRGQGRERQPSLFRLRVPKVVTDAQQVHDVDAQSV